MEMALCVDAERLCASVGTVGSNGHERVDVVARLGMLKDETAPMITVPCSGRRTPGRMLKVLDGTASPEEITNSCLPQRSTYSIAAMPSKQEGDQLQHNAVIKGTMLILGVWGGLLALAAHDLR